MNNERLHAKTKIMANKIMEFERNLVSALIVVQQREAYRDFDFKGLVTYGVKHLGFTVSVAQMYRTLVNHAIRLPALKVALEKNQISVAYASRIVSSLRPENVEEILQYTSEHSVRETQRWLVREKGEIHLLSLPIDTEVRELLREIKDFSSGNPSDIDLLKKILTEYRNRNSPVEKARRAHAKAHQPDSTNQVSEPSVDSANSGSRNHQRRPLTAKERHTVNLRDEGRCTYKDLSGHRCNSTRWLVQHHVHLVSEGGTNDPANILTLCPEHHDLVHQYEFSFEDQRDWFPQRETANSEKPLNVQ